MDTDPVDVSQRTLREFSERDASRSGSGADVTPASAGVTIRDRGKWKEEVSRFLEWKQSEAPVGDGWIRRMRWELERFPRLLERVGCPEVHLAPAAVGPEVIDRLRERLPWEKSTFRLHFAAVRPFLAWAGNPVAARGRVWALPSGEPTHRRWLTKEQLVQLYRASQGSGRLLIALEGFNGLRRVEVLRLRAKDVGLDEQALRVLGKGRNGGKWRTVPVYPQTRPLLERAVLGLRPSDRLLPISRSGADLLLTRTAAAAGLTAQGVRVSHHDLRRTFGRLAHAAGMDLIQLKNLFGHTSVEMTVHYIGLDADSMREGLERLRESLGHLR